jgi:hypothetical protein
VKLVVEFIHFFPCLLKSAPAHGSDAVETSSAAIDAIEAGAQKAGAFEAVKQRVQGAWADAITVMLQFLHHGQTKDGLVHRVQQHMDADQAIEKLPFLVSHFNKYTSEHWQSLD